MLAPDTAPFPNTLFIFLDIFKRKINYTKIILCVY